MNKLELAMAIDAADLPRGLLHGSMHRRRRRAPVLPLLFFPFLSLMPPMRPAANSMSSSPTEVGLGLARPP